MGIKSNNPAAYYYNMFSATGKSTEPEYFPKGHTASGGIINDYEAVSYTHLTLPTIYSV